MQRTPGGGFDLGDAGYISLGLAGACGVGYGVHRLRHARRHGTRVRFPGSNIGARVFKALAAHKAATGQTNQPTAQLRDQTLWTPLHITRRGFPAGERGPNTLPIDPTTTRGLGLVGPGADNALRGLSMGLAAHQPEDGTPTALLVITPDDAETLFGEKRPNPMPPGLHLAASVQHALQELEQIIHDRAAQPDTADRQPLVALVLAHQPNPHIATHLAALLHRGGPLGVTALILGHWAPATLAINGQIVTATHGKPNLAYLGGARLFNVPHSRANHYWSLLAHSQIPEPDPAHPDPAVTTHEPADAASNGQPPNQDTGDEQPALHTGSQPTAAGSDHDTEHAQQTQETQGTGDAADGWAAPMTEPDETGADTQRPPTRSNPRAAAPPDPAPEPDDDAAELDNEDDTASPPAPLTKTGLYLSFLGPIRLTQDGVDITPSEMPRQFLTLLALERPILRRAAIHVALWPDTPEESNALNMLISRGIRRNLRDATRGASENLIVVTPGKCGLNPDLINTDYWDLHNALALPTTTHPTQRADAFLKALTHYRGELATDIYQEWITPYREHTQQTITETAHTLAKELSRKNKLQKAVAVLEKARSCDPHHEDTYYKIIDAYTRLGQREQAVKKYRQLKNKLAEIGATPMRPPPA